MSGLLRHRTGGDLFLRSSASTSPDRAVVVRVRRIRTGVLDSRWLASGDLVPVICRLLAGAKWKLLAGQAVGKRARYSPIAESALNPIGISTVSYIGGLGGGVRCVRRCIAIGTKLGNDSQGSQCHII